MLQRQACAKDCPKLNSYSSWWAWRCGSRKVWYWPRVHAGTGKNRNEDKNSFGNWFPSPRIFRSSCRGWAWVWALSRRWFGWVLCIALTTFSIPLRNKCFTSDELLQVHTAHEKQRQYDRLQVLTQCGMCFLLHLYQVVYNPNINP